MNYLSKKASLIKELKQNYIECTLRISSLIKMFKKVKYKRKIQIILFT